jgi:thiamine-phosphate pyrophosphorylase
LCLVSDGTKPSGPSLIRLIAAAAFAGVDLIQIRERRLDDRALLSLTREAMTTVRGSAARVLVNDRLDVALAAGAAGVHLRGDSVPPSRARALAGAGFIIGRSVHDEDEAAAVDAEGGCDYLLFGSVFPTSSKPPGHRVAGLAALQRVCARVRIPVLAIGGISVERAAAVAAAGAAGVAAIGLFYQSDDLRTTVRAVRQAFDT